ncbi:MAG: hypothetical protein HDR90_09610 [Bacteroides sp.]|nr:hypothetical protein [Bacteroides sp.]
MKKIKIIPRPQLQSATRLSALQLNGFRCEKKHTLFTPEQLEKIAREAETSQK